MGSSASKVVKKTARPSAIATNIPRKYPTRSPPTSSRSHAETQTQQATPITRAGADEYADSKATGRRNKTAIQQNPEGPDSDLNLDPVLAARLNKLGPVQPTHEPPTANISPFHLNPNHQYASNTRAQAQAPTYAGSSQPSSSASSTPAQIFPPAPQSSATPNPAVSLLTARYRIAEEAEKEFAGLGKSGGQGRTFLDVGTLRQILALREKGVGVQEIERRLGLKEGVVRRLGGEGVVGVAGVGD